MPRQTSEGKKPDGMKPNNAMTSLQSTMDKESKILYQYTSSIQSKSGAIPRIVQE